MQGCCGDFCEKKENCLRYYKNLTKPTILENYASFGSGSINEDGCTTTFACGINGNYAMFVPISTEK